MLPADLKMILHPFFIPLCALFFKSYFLLFLLSKGLYYVFLIIKIDKKYLNVLKGF